VEVHRILGPGFFESIYELALDLELTSRGVSFGEFAGASSLPLDLSDLASLASWRSLSRRDRPDCTQSTQTQPIKTSAARY
jgi:hypothetical protein